MAFGWAGAAAGVQGARMQEAELENALAERAYKQALIQQAEQQNQRLLQQQQFEREKFAFDKQQAQVDADTQAADRRQQQNKAGVTSMVFEGIQQGTATPKVGRLILGREGVIKPEDALADPEAEMAADVERARQIAEAQYGTAAKYRAPASSGSLTADTQWVVGPDGKEAFRVPRAGDRRPPPMAGGGQAGAGGAGRPPSQAQFTVAGYAERIAQAESTIEGVTDAIVKMPLPQFAVQSRLPAAGQSKEMQQYWQAARNLINAQLRRESGAVISDSEFNEARAQYLPQPGDDAATLELKRKNRQQIFESNRRASGAAYAGGDWPQRPTPTPKVGDVKVFPNGKRGRFDGKGWVLIP